MIVQREVMIVQISPGKERERKGNGNAFLFYFGLQCESFFLSFLVFLKLNEEKPV